MTKDQIFSAWAPPQSIWSPWVKPVLFSHISGIAEDTAIPPIDLSGVDRADGSMAIVVDLPGVESIAAALSLIELGYRPVPLYNAVPESPADTALVEVRPIMIALASSVSALLNSRLPETAPPAFLLDSNRRSARVAAMPGMLDNRSISLPTDFPSGTFLQSRGIDQALLIQSESAVPQADLSHTLRRWQDLGVKMVAKEITSEDAPYPIIVQTPPAFKVLWYNLLATMGLKVSPLGGFGGRLPLPSGG